MNELTLLSKRLGAVANLSAFSRRWKIPYRTLQRMKKGHLGTPTLATFNKIVKALDKGAI